MPYVTDDFVAHAEKLAGAMQEKLEKEASADKSLKANAEMVADTLIEQGLVPTTQKHAAVASLLDHEQALQALNKTAQIKGGDVTPATDEEGEEVSAMGKTASTEKEASVDYRGEEMRDSDRALLRGLGLGV